MQRFVLLLVALGVTAVVAGTAHAASVTSSSDARILRITTAGFNQYRREDRAMIRAFDNANLAWQAERAAGATEPSFGVQARILRVTDLASQLSADLLTSRDVVLAEPGNTAKGRLAKVLAARGFAALRKYADAYSRAAELSIAPGETLAFTKATNEWLRQDKIGNDLLKRVWALYKR